MALPKISDIWNHSKLRAQLEAAHAKADSALTAAKISTLKVNGADVPAFEAPLSDKIAAVSALMASGEKTQPMSELIAANGEIASQLEEVHGKLVTANATISSLTQEKAILEGKLGVANTNVQTLTSTNANNENLLSASNKEVTRMSNQLTSQKKDLAQRCLAANCLELRGEDGKLLSADASDGDKLAAAMKISHEDLFKAYTGAVNSAIAKTGVTFANIPNAAPSTETGAHKPEVKGRDRFTAAVKAVR